MQYLSGLNLSEGVLDFIRQSDSITIFSPYLKLEELRRIHVENKIKCIVVRWEIQDLCLGVSDLELYHYCRDNNIALYRNTRIHLKVLWDKAGRIFFGSANVTQKGLGALGNYNFELNGYQNNLNFETVKYLNKIILASEYITEELYKEIKSLVAGVAEPEIVYPILNSEKTRKDNFLLSDLPMSKTVNNLYKIYQNPEGVDNIERNCAAHDLVLYEIIPGLNRVEFDFLLQKNFNNHPFIMALKDHIKMEGSVRYGGVVKWIQDHTSTVPTPRSWELKKYEIVNILYIWITTFDNMFSWDIPGKRSETIHYQRSFI